MDFLQKYLEFQNHFLTMIQCCIDIKNAPKIIHHNTHRAFIRVATSKNVYWDMLYIFEIGMTWRFQNGVWLNPIVLSTEVKNLLSNNKHQILLNNPKKLFSEKMIRRVDLYNKISILKASVQNWEICFYYINVKICL